MNPSTVQATVIVDELVRCGVRDAVLCPGSRNAPLSFALHAADAEGRLRLHVRVDERGAGFLAVGLGLRSRRAVPVVCTSGTAVANLHPAVLEASYNGAPLVAITTDRPIELHGTGAGQTIEQAGLFGHAVRATEQLAIAERRAGQHGRWRSTVDRVVASALGTLSGDSGPAQLNVPFREPLVPDHEGDWPEPVTGRDGGKPWSGIAPRFEHLEPAELDPDASTLVIAGQGAHGPVPPELPVLAEPGSELWHRSLRTGMWLLPAALSGEAPWLFPDQVVVLGRPTMHRSVQRLLADERVAVFAVPPASAGRVRPQWTDLAGSVRGVGALPKSWAPHPAFGARWQHTDNTASHLLDASLDAEPWATGPALAASVVAALPADSLLFAGPSNPVRDIALAARPRDDVTVIGNRGVAGIDGVVSAAIGASLAHHGPGYALMGDLTFLHDAGGLLLGPDEPRPDLTIVVANDNGGSVFATLEQGAPEHAGAFERIFGTPLNADLSALCRAVGVEHTLATGTGDLLGALRPGRGPRVVEVPVNRSDRRALHHRLRAAVTRFS
ncbi:2-succinyl-5-enolpyruvyl-6-hydroxy-3-cyclohexene-1-carboxylic-acid synthase [Amycolatopsis sp. YIM 10]|uniref:2-succinyl-5-enolpyruvyl-6-hydroxy-3- cyclohexene-1-carboxylic-acid synthase n=1 Tax=Amycolatopsis sp. YIM 10 TaxID=2653857 RepID=UPI0012903F78|nr:2-succinyl-5-enolpyruvyl-6-hydroxy-3-cyclohexene-1-carboxylic-acid synthase [Amycolatopsis sp. YIM 10]